MSQEQAVSMDIVEAILDAFNAHDLDAIMEFFADGCSRTSTTAMSAIGSAATWWSRSGC
ncbi:hypothetical protein BH18ACT7_BH18ACT7_03730 [soil metagenome]